jgi:hypothetical protein
MSQNINLYDASLRITRDWLSPQSFAAVVGGALLFVTASASLAHWYARQLAAPARDTAAALQSQQNAILELTRQVDTLRPNPKLIAEVTTTQATLEQRRAALQLLHSGSLGQQEGPAPALRAFARQAVDGLWLTGLVLDRRDMALRGRALSPDLIPSYVGRLNLEPALQGRSFRTLDIDRPVDAADAAAAAASMPKPGMPPATPRLAAYVEFALSGAGGAVVAGKGDKR